ncbi:MAG: MBL fold metallo-hydrolase [Patescibacteria group bacterium]|nr:MBL fold metallo-hydrolase [Patescibacteria group bacterium]
MKNITFLGAAGTVTGSSYFLSDETGKGILIDMGMFQGNDEIESYNNESIPLHPYDILGVFLTHAHLDHCGRLPLLRKLGYKGAIYMTDATKSLVELILLDAVHVARNHEYGKLLYNELDVHWVLQHVKTVQYHELIHVGPWRVTFIDAGHILGSASVCVHNEHDNDGINDIIFSGDIGNYPEDLVKPTEFIKTGNVVVMESTYGDRMHGKEDPNDVLAEEIQIIEKTKGTLLIPSFSLERSQEILHMIDHLKKNHQVKESTPVFLDSVLAIQATRVYQRYKCLYSEELRDHVQKDDPFSFPGLSMVETYQESKMIDTVSGPKVIIAGSGMMTGGRILRHAQIYLSDPSTRVLFVGFQAEGTLGRLLLDGAKHVSIEGQYISVKATIRKSSGLSSHADQPKLLAWLSHIKQVSSVCLTHGEDPQREILRHGIQEKLPHIAVYTPHKGDTLRFGNENAKIMYYGSSTGRRYFAF